MHLEAASAEGATAAFSLDELLLLNNALWLFIGLPGLIVVLVMGAHTLYQLRHSDGGKTRLAIDPS